MKRLALVLCAALAAPLAADEGMWMPSQLPAFAAELAAAGLELDPARLADLTGDPLGAIVSLGGCTASFVSPDGLIVTNHHCVYGSLQYNSTPERDLVADGFLAKRRAEELPAAPGSSVWVTTAIRDVTDEVRGDPNARLSDASYARAVDRRTRERVDACEKPGGVRCRVASFFEGSLFLEVIQSEVRDVRLVYAPASGIGNYGGEIDNWMWPRHTGDFGFLRAYVAPDGSAAEHAAANVPYRPKHWLKVSTAAVRPGDLVWIPGYPGRTFRYRTAAEVRAAHEYAMPRFAELARDLIALLEEENARGREVELANYARIRGLANTLKKYEGQLLAMRDGSVEAELERREAKLREAPALARVLDRLDAMTAEKRATERRDFALDAIERASVLYAQAFKLVRLAEERAKPDLDREEGYRDRDLQRLIQGLVRAQRSIEPASDRAGLRHALGLALALPADQRIVELDRRLAATGGATDAGRIEALLDGLYAGTRVGDLATRREMAGQSSAELAARGDAMLDLALALAPLDAGRRERDKAHEGAALRVRPDYLRAIAKLAGHELYPDANGTLRVTWGRVEGFRPRDAVVYEPRTTLAGVVAKATGESPFDAPTALLEAAKSIPSAYRDPDLGDVAVDFLSTCDITGGNSGSPTLNGRGELVGLAFDTNWEGVVSDFDFRDEVARSIHVGATYMRWVMDEVDGAEHLLVEMGLPVTSPGD
jgi:hypothetical protein